MRRVSHKSHTQPLTFYISYQLSCPIIAHLRWRDVTLPVAHTRLSQRGACDNDVTNLTPSTGNYSTPPLTACFHTLTRGICRPVNHFNDMNITTPE